MGIRIFHFIGARKGPFVYEETSPTEPSSPPHSGRFGQIFASGATRVCVAYEADAPWVPELDAFFGGTVSCFGFYDGTDEGN